MAAPDSGRIAQALVPVFYFVNPVKPAIKNEART